MACMVSAWQKLMTWTWTWRWPCLLFGSLADQDLLRTRCQCLHQYHRCHCQQSRSGYRDQQLWIWDVALMGWGLMVKMKLQLHQNGRWLQLEWHPRRKTENEDLGLRLALQHHRLHLQTDCSRLMLLVCKWLQMPLSLDPEAIQRWK